jgi:glycerophosphoryl diester phosphodiesterase
VGSDGKILVAHRGASAYAPEHTRAAYELAIEQGADYIEPDLQITADGVLIALHDISLERTTNVEELFPDRFRLVQEAYAQVPHWMAVDFTLEEIKQLDAGTWFDPRFTNETILTFAEVIEIARGRAGIFPETKGPEFYSAEGFDMDELVVRELRAHGLDVPGGVDGTPVQLQSFSLESLRALRHEHGLDLPSTFLIGGYTAARRWFRPVALDEIAEVATGIGPSKAEVIIFEQVIQDAHARGLTVIPYTFGGRDPADFEATVIETRYFLEELGVDGLFTNNPDLFPR